MVLQMFNPSFVNHPKVLIVDDDPFVGLLVSESLSDMAEVRQALSEEEALPLVDEWEPNLVLLDLNLREAQSLDFCQHILSLPSVSSNDLAVIFMTASESEVDERNCWDAGASDFVSKPINVLTLRKRLGVHLRLQQYTNSLKQQALVDGLTNAFNRRYLDEYFDNVLKHHRRVQEPLSLIMVDVDFFKLYNDHYGHIAGDEVLKEVASKLRELHVRPQDQLIRYGGEEFLVVLPETDQSGSSFLAKTLVQTIQDMKIPHKRSQFGVVTVSAGVVTSTCELDDQSAYLESVDRALYRAKHLGRNRLHRGAMQDEVSVNKVVALDRKIKRFSQ